MLTITNKDYIIDEDDDKWKTIELRNCRNILTFLIMSELQ